jgi:hypothetical protein
MVQQLNDANLYNVENFRTINRLTGATAPALDPLAFSLPAVPTTRPALDPLALSLPAVPTTRPTTAPLSGLGIKNQVLPQTVIFGKIAIDLNKLYYQNVLSIKRHNGNKIIGHKNKRVSDNFVEIVFKCLIINL